jgi:transposase-like protein
MIYIGEGMMTKLLQKEKVKLKCPHCKQEIVDVWICEMNSIIGMRYAYLCSNCQKLIGICSMKDSSSTKSYKSFNSVFSPAF